QSGQIVGLHSIRWSAVDLGLKRSESIGRVKGDCAAGEIGGKLVGRGKRRLHVDLLLPVEVDPACADVADLCGVIAVKDVLDAEGPLFGVGQLLVRNEG